MTYADYNLINLSKNCTNVQFLWYNTPITSKGFKMLSQPKTLDLLGINQAAEAAISIHRAVLEQWINKGKISPHYRIGNRYSFDRNRLLKEVASK